MRSNKEIVEQTNRLALEILNNNGFIPEKKGETKVYLSKHIEGKRAWGLACLAQEFFTETDAAEALDEMLDDEAPVERVDYKDHTGVKIEAGQRVTIDGGHSDDWEAFIVNKENCLWWVCFSDGDQVKITNDNCSSIEINR